MAAMNLRLSLNSSLDTLSCIDIHLQLSTPPLPEHVPLRVLLLSFSLSLRPLPTATWVPFRLSYHPSPYHSNTPFSLPFRDSILRPQPCKTFVTPSPPSSRPTTYVTSWFTVTSLTTPHNPPLPSATTHSAALSPTSPAPPSS